MIWQGQRACFHETGTPGYTCTTSIIPAVHVYKHDSADTWSLIEDVSREIVTHDEGPNNKHSLNSGHGLIYISGYLLQKQVSVPYTDTRP